MEITSAGVLKTRVDTGEQMHQLIAELYPICRSITGDGVVTRRNFDTGHLTMPGASGDPLFVVARSDVVTVSVGVPEADAPLVGVGDPAEVRLQVLDGRTFKGKVTRTSWSLDPAEWIGKHDGPNLDWSGRFVIQNMSDTVPACVQITYLSIQTDGEVAWEPYKLPDTGKPANALPGCPNGGMPLPARGSIFKYPDNMSVSVGDAAMSEFRYLVAKHRPASEAAGVRLDAARFSRGIAYGHLRAGRRLRAARTYLRGAAAGNLGDLARAAAAAIGGPAARRLSHDKGVPAPHVDWLDQAWPVETGDG